MSKAKATQDDKSTKEYRYTQEISQMMFVFGEVQDPNPVAVNLVEDIVRSQVLEIVIQAKQLSAKRGARTISPEDLIFIIRDDRAKVNRLRTYMSWKDVRKNAKEEGKDVMEEALEDGADDQNVSKAKKKIIKLSWDIKTIYTDVLKTLAANNPNRHGDLSDDEDEDETEAHDDSIKRLKDADEITRNMTKEEYMHYSECRQASFTYRKGKRFREYLNLPPQLELRSDDTIDILGFLAFETVRALTIGGLEVKRAFEDAALDPSASMSSPESKKRKLLPSNSAAPSPSRPTKRLRGDDGVDMSAVSGAAGAGGTGVDKSGVDRLPWSGAAAPRSTLFLAPPEARTPLTPQHIHDAFARMQRKTSRMKGAGMKNWQGGLVRTTISLI